MLFQRVKNTNGKVKVLSKVTSSTESVSDHAVTYNNDREFQINGGVIAIYTKTVEKQLYYNVA